MSNVNDLIDRYVAVWNESNADERRKRIRALWAPDGATCYRLLDARGYDAIEARVTSSWDKWLREGKYVFRRKRVACHHDVVKFDWEMVTVPDGKVAADGLNFLILNADGRIQSDYQFNPTVDEASELVDRYVAVFNESDAQARHRRIAELFAPDGSFVSETIVRNGHRAIEAEAIEAHHGYVTKGYVFVPAGSSHRHHNVARIKWRMQDKDSGEVAATGSEFLLLDENGRVRLDYQYDEPHHLAVDVAA
jgi:hypothetical protein